MANAATADDVYCWRLHVLLNAGCPMIFADWIAGSDADLHEAVYLIEMGCPPATAVRILI